MGWSGTYTKDPVNKWAGLLAEELNGTGWIVREVTKVPRFGEEGHCWSVVPYGDGYIFLLTLIDMREGEVMFKTMDESMGPFVYDVSASWLKRYPAASGLGMYSERWRKEAARRASPDRQEWWMQDNPKGGV